MKKLLFILPAILFTLAVNAQQTEDEVYIGKGKTFGNYKGTGIIIPDVDFNAKPIKRISKITGMVVGACKEDCCNNKRTSCSLTVQYGDSLVTIGAGDYGLIIPKNIVGKNIIIEGMDRRLPIRDRRNVNNNYQKDIQFAATGIKVIE